MLGNQFDITKKLQIVYLIDIIARCNAKLLWLQNR